MRDSFRRASYVQRAGSVGVRRALAGNGGEQRSRLNGFAIASGDANDANHVGKF